MNILEVKKDGWRTGHKLVEDIGSQDTGLWVGEQIINYLKILVVIRLLVENIGGQWVGDPDHDSW